MRKRLIEKFTRAKEGSLGYTLMEVMVVIGIIAIVCAIAIPSFLALRSSMLFKQANDYAKSIFLAAQQNLSEMRANNGLGPLQEPDAKAYLDRHKPGCGFPDASMEEYVYVSTGNEGEAGYTARYFDLVLPVGSIDDTLRSEQVIIEFNPLTGNVYSVFFCQNDKTDLVEKYNLGAISREDEDSRKKAMVGYYQGSELNSSAIELEGADTELTFYNGQEGILEIRVPVPELYQENYHEFAQKLSVELTIKGQMSSMGSGAEGGDETNGFEDIFGTNGFGQNNTPAEEQVLTIPLAAGSFQYYTELEYENEKARLETAYGESQEDDTQNDQNASENIDADSGQTLVIPFVLDSLKDHSSFANVAALATDEAAMSMSLTHFANESVFGNVVLPGENLDIEALVSYDGGDAGLLTYEKALLPDVNPFFAQLGGGSTADKYTIYVANGRHLQNLNALPASLASKIESVNFSNDIHWDRTVGYYTDVYKETVSAGGRYENAKSEAPARALPYFVPIHHENLFGTARFAIADGDNDGGLGELLADALAWYFGTYGERDKTPALTDELDVVNQNGVLTAPPHAVVQGNGYQVAGLEIDANQYEPFTYNSGRFYAMGPNQVLDYYFTGLFAYANTSISGVNVVNPIVRGHSFTVLTAQEDTREEHYLPQYDGSGNITYVKQKVLNNPATGALLGVGGFNTLLTNCSAYVDTNADGFVSLYHEFRRFDKDEGLWYGVKGDGAVGGLVGFCKSHKTVSDDLTDDESKLAFSRCFAAVNVMGNMRGKSSSLNYGYTNGVGGLLGNSQISNFYNCYASGNVKADGYYVESNGDADREGLKLQYNGYTGQGAGGFVGTSHGTHYTNCFSTGNVEGQKNSGLGVGGFVGFMSIDETVHYRKNDQSNKITQRTVFTNCYSVGDAQGRESAGERFSGANGRVSFDPNTIVSGFIGDYYRLYAPKAMAHYLRRWNLNGYDGPDYEDFYTYRDSYYLSQYLTDAGDKSDVNSNGCAEPQSYDDFINMTVKHTWNSRIPAAENWIHNKIEDIKGEKISEAYIKGMLGGSRAEDLLAAIADAQELTIGNVFFEGLGIPLLDIENRLTKKYQAAYSEGFPSEHWEDTTGKRVPYRTRSVYPFTKLKGLDYYGDYPSRPSAVGMAYYEVYDGVDHPYFLFHQEIPDGMEVGESSYMSLKNGTDIRVVEDGYVLLSSTPQEGSSHRMQVTLNGGDAFYAEYTGVECRVTANQKYYTFTIPMDKLEEALVEGEYYVTVKAKQDGVEYTMYVNPYTAKSHINPDGNDADRTPPKPTALPETISIRSARQFAGISKLTKAWGKDAKYVQELNIDASTYRWAGEKAPELGSIGTENDPFGGSYKSGLTAPILDENGVDTGRAEIVQAQLKGFTPSDEGIFGVVATTGSVEELDITVGKAELKTNASSAGILVGASEGRLVGLDLTLTGDVSITAKHNAGLLAGSASGIITDCHVQTPLDETSDADEPISVRLEAANAGGYIGLAGKVQNGDEAPVRTEISGGALELHGDITVVTPVPTAETVNQFYAGGVFGQAHTLDIQEGLTAKLNSLTMNMTPVEEEPEPEETQPEETQPEESQPEESQPEESQPEESQPEETLPEPEVKTEVYTYAGGLAGLVQDGVFQTVKLNVAAAAKNESGILAGAFASADKVSMMDAVIELHGLEGRQAAGLLGDTRGVTLSNCKLDLGTVEEGKAHVQGVDAAAGVAITVGPQSTMDAMAVNLSGMTIHASEGKAAGFAVEISAEASVTGAAVTMSPAVKYGDMEDETAPVTVISGAEAAGFAHTIGGTVQSSEVRGHGRISGDSLAAGFALALTDRGHISQCAVTPAVNDDDYLGNSNDNLLIECANGDAAGSVHQIGSNATVRGCYALGTIHSGENGVAYGFAGSLGADSQLETSFANVTVNGGVAFLGSNDGVVSRCYGWYAATEADMTVSAEVDARSSGTIFSSYFIDRNADYEIQKGATLFTATGEQQEMSAAAVGTEDAMALLTGSANGEDQLFAWYASAAYGAKPYSDHLLEETYNYPMLHEHYGDWAIPSVYSNGIAYYETYADGVKLHILDLTDREEFMLGGYLDGYYHVTQLEGNAAPMPAAQTQSVFDGEGEILDAGYYVFSRHTASEEEPELVLIQSYDDVVEGAQVAYGFYPMQTVPEVDGNGNPIHINPAFADAIFTGGSFKADGEPYEYQIRWGEQFAAVPQTDANFVQTHDITVADVTSSITVNEGRYYQAAGASLKIENPLTVPLFAGVNGGTVTLGDIALTADGSTEVPVLFGAIDGNAVVSGGTVDMGNAKVDGVFTSIGEGAQVSGFHVQNVSELTGALVGGSLKGELRDVKLDASKATIVLAEDGSSKGLLANTNHGTISGCAVTIAAPGDALVHVSGSGSFGLVAGTNTGAIENTVAAGEIVYTQGEADAAAIGALVGTMDGGTITGTGDTDLATGSIALAEDETGAGRSHTVGGAVGIVTTGTIADVQVNVAVDSRWQNTAAVDAAGKTYGDQAEDHPVGMFVGYVANTTLTNCVSKAANETFQFLGEALVNGETFESPLWISNTEENHDTLVAYLSAGEMTEYSVEDHEGVTIFQTNENSTYSKVAVSLNDCQFQLAETMVTVSLGGVVNYYEETERADVPGYSAQKVAPFDHAAAPVGKDMLWGETMADTAYYVFDGANYGRMQSGLVANEASGYDHCIQWFTAEGTLSDTLTIPADNLDEASIEAAIQAVHSDFDVVAPVTEFSQAVEGQNTMYLFSPASGFVLSGVEGAEVPYDGDPFTQRDAELCAAIWTWNGNDGWTANSGTTVVIAAEDRLLTTFAEENFYAAEALPEVTIDFGTTQCAIYKVSMEQTDLFRVTFTQMTDNVYDDAEYVVYHSLPEAAPASWWDRLVAWWMGDQEGA